MYRRPTVRAFRYWPTRLASTRLRIRANVSAFIKALVEEELSAFPRRLRHGLGGGPVKGSRHGHRARQLTGTFGTETVRVPRARTMQEPQARTEDETGKMT